jgi:hypothetical protein
MQRSAILTRLHTFLDAKETDAEAIRAYASDLKDELRRGVKSVNLDAGIVLVLGVLFGLASAKGISDFTAFGIKVTQYGAFVAILPPAMAFLLSRITMRISTLDVVRAVYYAINARRFPVLSQMNLDDLVVPSFVPFTEEPSLFCNDGSWSWRLQSFLSTLSVLLLVVLPPVFFVSAYYYLFHQFHASNAFVWFSLIATCGLAVSAGTLYAVGRVSD